MARQIQDYDFITMYNVSIENLKKEKVISQIPF